MRIDRLDIRSLPGLDDRFTLEPGPGVNLLLGPNASGKSSVARAVRDLLWPSLADGQARWLRAVMHDAGGELVVTCDGREPAWSRGGAAAPRPSLPDAHLAPCYRVTAADLLGGDHAFDRDLAAAIRREMTGGIDLDKLADELDKPQVRRRNELEQALRATRDRSAEVTRRQGDLARRRADLDQLRADVASARAAGRRAEALRAARDLAQAVQASRDAEAALQACDAVMPAVNANDLQTYRELGTRLAAKRELAERLEAQRRQLADELAGLVLPQAGDPTTLLARLAGLVRDFKGAEAAAQAAADHRASAARLAGAAADAALAAAADADPQALARIERLLLETDAALGALEEARQEAGGGGPALPWLIGAAVLAVAAAMPLPGGVPARAAAAVAAIVLGAVGTRGLTARARRSTTESARRQRDAAAERLRALQARLETHSAELARSEALAAQKQSDRDAARGRVAEACAAWGEDPPRTGAEAEAMLGALTARVERAVARRAQLAQVTADREAASAEATQAEAARGALLARLGLPAQADDEAPVARLVDALEPWRRTVADHKAASAVLRERAERWRSLAEAAGLDPTAPDLADLEARIDAARVEEQRLQDLVGALTNLERDLAEAEAGHDLAAALAAEAEAQADLEAWNDDALAQRLEAALLADLHRRHETLSAPEDVRRADDLLGAFTRGRYGLKLGRDAKGSTFLVRDRETAADLGLDTLSDGTRMQVLLAVRLAFLAGIEAGARPPLFLDETLTTSDPARMAAIASTVAAAARATGRQVFYLTSQPADVGAWRAALAGADLPPPRVLDLAAARRQGAAATESELAPVAPAAIPGPGSDDPATYGRRLGVAAFDPHAGWEPLDTFHLAGGDLGLVHRLREAGAVRAGVLAAVLPRLAEAGLVSDGQRRRLELALAVARAFIPAWSAGRPRPATIADIDTCEALSDTMRPRALALLGELAWNAHRFLDALDNNGIARLQRKIIDDVRVHLAERGLLDARAPLDADALAASVVLNVTALNADARTSLEDMRALVHHLLGAIPRAIADDPSSRPSSGSGPSA
ncbi:MAG TPA: AAA family ATPase [Candidatus Krumholzibacteria bacterium]|nr:AAA family ATPase [Candidatus Krumholzibacteria bacterium]